MSEIKIFGSILAVVFLVILVVGWVRRMEDTPQDEEPINLDTAIVIFAMAESDLVFYHEKLEAAEESGSEHDKLEAEVDYYMARSDYARATILIGEAMERMDALD